MKARISLAMGHYWGGIAYAFDVMAAISALGAIGALPALLNALVRFTRVKFPIAIALTAILFALPGCARTAIRGSASAEGDAPNAIRTLGSDLRFSTLSSQSVARRVRAEHPGQPINILALSGGGADGAFGAGALVGLTRSTRRPEFSVVTGVSTGALIAPYAFLGPDWDDELVEVYTSGRAEHLLKSRGLGAFFGSSIYSGTPLKELVDRYATDALIQAVAREASTGRLRPFPSPIRSSTRSTSARRPCDLCSNSATNALNRVGCGPHREAPDVTTQTATAAAPASPV
jgi:patatin-like phospholipase